jgi:site-specific recombinase XerD
MDAEPLLPPHLDYLMLRNQRPRSIRERRLAVMRTNRRLGKPVADVTRDDLKTWQQTISGLTPAGQHNEIVHTIQYLRWVIDIGHREDDPTRVIIRPRNVHRSLPRPMSDTDISVALLTAPHPERAWIALMAFCGLRCMEVADMRRDWILDNQTPPLLAISGKGGKQRTIPLPDRVYAELLDAAIPVRGWCWTRMDGQPGPPSATRVSERLNRHLHQHGIPGTAHALRHRFGTALWRETRDALLVARVMGHASVDTTKMYVLISPTDAVSPLEAISRLQEPKL